MRLYKRAALGAEAGLLAGIGVILLFFVQDSFSLAPLSTPEALAGSLFGPRAIPLEDGVLATAAGVAVFGAHLISYTLLHFLTFALLGIGAAFVVGGASWKVTLGAGALYGLTACSAVFYGSRLALDSPVVLDSVGVPSILVANTVAGIIMAGGLTLVRNPEAEEARPRTRAA